MKYSCCYDSPVGHILITAESGYITRISLCDGNVAVSDCGYPDVLDTCVRQMEEYFGHKRTVFSVPFRYEGTVFQKKVWSSLMGVPYGSTCTYSDIAVSVGCGKGVRAVGNAVHANPLPILVPCHRVIRKSGSDGGYAWGAEIKRFFLELESGKSSEHQI